MYLREVEIENNGPIGYFKLALPFENDLPKPVVIIGQNGSGKSICISHIVNALISAKQTFYEDSEVEKGKVYKYRSPSYIRTGSHFSYSKVVFENNFHLIEWQLDRKRKDFESELSFTSVLKDWNKIREDETSHFESNFQNNQLQLRTLIDQNTILYFPPNRFEEPAWLNQGDLLIKADYRFTNRVSTKSNRFIINHSPLKDNQNWLLDIVLDKYSLEINTQNFKFQMQNGGSVPLPVFLGHQGESNNIYNAIIGFLKLLFQTNEPLRFGIGKRRNRAIAIMKNEQPWIPNIFNLSTGESILLNIFLTIIKDYDLSTSPFLNLKEVKGIVVIDEIDVHLHSNLQYTVLPQLIKLFPKVQFIITSHSPLFLLGLKNEVGENNFKIFNLPSGAETDIEGFSEFENAYNYFRQSVKFRDEIKREIESSFQDLIFVEGDYDIKYLNRAAELLGRIDILKHFKLVDSIGYGSIDKVARNYDSKLAEVIPQKIILLYDCDTNKINSNNGKVFKRVVESIKSSPIEKGIENLFNQPTLAKALGYKPDFIDILEEHRKKVRGKAILIPEKWEINKDEKRNLCDWICHNGTKDDFFNFNSVFDMLEEIYKL